MIQQFEEGLVDSLQEDPTMAACLNTYLEARKRLAEKGRNRGFWPVRSGKGKGRGRSKGAFGRPRKSLQQRILESDCRRCGQRGHWKAECPLNKGSASTSSNAPAAPTMTIVQDQSDAPEDVFQELPPDAEPLEEVWKPTDDCDTNSDAQVAHAFCIINKMKNPDKPESKAKPVEESWLHQLRQRVRRWVPDREREQTVTHRNRVSATAKADADVPKPPGP